MALKEEDRSLIDLVIDTIIKSYGIKYHEDSIACATKEHVVINNITDILIIKAFIQDCCNTFT